MTKITHIRALCLALLAFCALSAHAQSPSHIMSHLLHLLENNAIETRFGLVVKEANATTTHTMNGTFRMQGNRFTLHTDQMQVFFDGTTQWAYMPQINEVTITTPTEKELAETNPLALLRAYSTKSAIQHAKENTRKNTYTLQLTPNDKKADIRFIHLVISKTNYHPLSIQLTDKNGTISTLALTQFQPNAPVTATTFTFNPAIYADIEINDLR